MFSIIKNNKGFILFLIFLFVFRGAIADWHRVPTGSLKPTILEGDMIFVNKLAYNMRLPFSDVTLKQTGTPKRGEIVVFKSKKEDKRFIKRLVGLPGDTLELRRNILIINGVVSDYQQDSNNTVRPVRDVDAEAGTYLIESSSMMPPHRLQIKPHIQNPISSFRPIVVPDSHYFFMGDNRDNSGDSRVFGFIPRSELLGRAARILVSLNKNDRYKPRWERFGQSLTYQPDASAGAMQPVTN